MRFGLEFSTSAATLLLGAGIIACILSVSAASFMLIIAGCHSRSAPLIKLGIFYQFPFLLYFTFYVIQQVRGSAGLMLTQLFFVAFIAYFLLAGLIAQPWRQEVETQLT